MNFTEIVHFVLFPLLSAQLVLVVLLYFIFQGRYLLQGAVFHLCYLSAYAFYLSAKALQSYVPEDVQLNLLFIRVVLLFSVGIPAMHIATAMQVGETQSLRLKQALFVSGALVSVGYIWLVNMALMPGGVTPWPFGVSVKAAEYLMLCYIVAVLVLPCCYWFYLQWRADMNSVALTFILGSVCFSGSHIVSVVFESAYWVLYAGAMLTALCWCWAVYQDIRFSKARANFLSEELVFMALTGGKSTSDDVRHRLSELEQNCTGDLALYKRKLRDIMSRLMNQTSSAGVDSNALIARGEKNHAELMQSRSVSELNDVFCAEVEQLSVLVADVPSNKALDLSDKIEAYLVDHYHQAIDVAHLAELFGLSQSYLMRQFKAATGQTINQRLVAIRIDKAKQLLLKKLSVTETAFSVGFNSSTYFSSAFKKEVGLSPVQYQKTVQR